jgi:hypothetical protein
VAGILRAMVTAGLAEVESPPSGRVWRPAPSAG